MASISLMNLPRELIYLIFEYLDKKDIVYSFFELNNYFSLIVKYFIGKQFDLTKNSNDKIFQYCLSKFLPSIGSNLRYLSIGNPYHLSTYIQSLKIYCPNLDILNVYCCSDNEDIRYYIAHLIHHQLLSLTFIFNNEIVGEQISLRLLDKSIDEHSETIPIALSLRLYLSSMNDLILLKRYSESNYLSDGLYMIECTSNGEWLTDSKDDLFLMSKKFHRERIFSIKQIDKDQCNLEYELYHEQSQRRATVLTFYEDEERWISSSFLSIHRKESLHSCAAFTFERIIDHENQYYIRPCYSNAKRLQVLGKRIIVSRCDNENELNHRFRLHRIL
jgi:hypothetical protein